MSNNPPLTAKELLPELGKTDIEVVKNICLIFWDSAKRGFTEKSLTVFLDTYRYGEIAIYIDAHILPDSLRFAAIQTNKLTKYYAELMRDSGGCDITWNKGCIARQDFFEYSHSRLKMRFDVHSFRYVHDMIRYGKKPNIPATAEWFPQIDKSVEMFTKLNARIKELEESLRLRDLALDDAYRQLKEMSMKLK